MTDTAPPRRTGTDSNQSMFLTSEIEKKMMDDEFRREMSYGPFTEVAQTDDEMDKQLVRRMMRQLLSLYQNEAEIPKYGRAGIGDGAYGSTSGVSATGFRDYITKFLPDPENSIGTFIRLTPLMNKKGSKLTEKTLVRRLEDLYKRNKAVVVRRAVEELCSEIVARNQIEKFLDQLLDDERPCQHAVLENIKISSNVIQEVADAVEGHPALQTLTLVGNGLGTFRTTALSHSTTAPIQESGQDGEDDAPPPLIKSGSTTSASAAANERLIEALSAALAKTKSLTSLTLSANGLNDRDMPSICRLTRLVMLNLSNNDIDDSGAQLLADSLPFFRNLKNLDVSRNRIGDTGMTAICNALTNRGELPLKLQVFKLGFNKIRGAAWKALADALPRTRTLALLDVSGNRLVKKDGLANAFGKALQANTSITVLAMSSMDTDAAVADKVKLEGPIYEDHVQRRNHAFDIHAVRMGDELLPVIAGVIVNNRLVSLDLGNNCFSPQGAQQLCKLLFSSTQLKTLQLQWNDIRDTGVNTIAKLLKNGKTSIQELDVSYNQITGDGLERLLKVTAKGGRTIPLLKLNIAGNYLPGERLPFLIKILNSRNQELSYLDASDLDCRAIWRVADALADRNRGLRTLIIARNNIHFKGTELAEEFARKILSSKTLAHLDVSFNELGDDGALAFARHLRDNTALRHLDLSSNGLTKPSAYGIALSLAHNRTLSTLQMRWNYISAQGADALLDMMATNPVLVNVDVAGFGVPFRFKKEQSHGAGVFHTMAHADEVPLPSDSRTPGATGEPNTGHEAMPEPAKVTDEELQRALAAQAANDGDGNTGTETKAKTPAREPSTTNKDDDDLNDDDDNNPMDDEVNSLAANRARMAFTRQQSVKDITAVLPEPAKTKSEQDALNKPQFLDDGAATDDEGDDWKLEEDDSKASKSKQLVKEIATEIDSLAGRSALDRQNREREQERIQRQEQHQKALEADARRKRASNDRM